MGANSTRVTQVLVSNTAAANVNSTPATIVQDELLLVNRAGTVVADAGTVISDINNDVVRFALGTSATAGVVKWSAPIHVRGIRKVTKMSYEAPVQHRVVISAASLGTITTGKVYSIKLNFHDTNRILADHESAQFYTYTTLATDTTATLVFDGIRAAINGIATANKQVVASGTSTLILDGLAVADNALGFPQFRYFDVSLRKGFTYVAGSSVTVTAGKPGRGLGDQVKFMELAEKYGFNRTMFPVDTDTRRAVSGNAYNLVVIEYGTPHLSVMHSTYIAPQTIVLAFVGATLADGVINGSAFTSAKQLAIMTKLNSLVESAGTFVQ